MKSVVLVLIIAVTVYAVDEPLKRHDKSGIERMLQDIAERGEEMQQEGDEVDSDKGDVIEALRALFAPRCKRNTVLLADPTLVPTDDSAPVGSTDSATVAPEDPTTVASTGESDDAAHEEMTVSPSKMINLGQARLKRPDTTAESKKNKRTEQQVQRKSTAVLDRFAASAESAVPRKEKSLIELENKTSEEGRVSRKHGSPTKKAHHDEKEDEEKKVNPQKKDDEQPAVHTVGRRVSVKATQNGDANVRPHVRDTDKQPPVSSTGDIGNVKSREVIRAKNPQTKPQSINFSTASPKNIKTGTKKASAASARNGVPNKEQRPVEREAQASISTAKPAA